MTEFPDTQSFILANIQTLEDREAWEKFAMIYRPIIYRMARRRGFQDSDAQDLAQEVLFRIAKSIDGWEPRKGIRFRHWVRKVATNAIITALTKSNRPEINDSTADDIIANTPEAALTTREIENEYLREQYLRAAAIVKLDVSPVTWQAFERTVIQHESCEDAARSLGKSIGVIYAARSRVLKRLQIEIQRTEGTSE